MAEGHQRGCLKHLFSTVSLSVYKVKYNDIGLKLTSQAVHKL